MKKSIVLFVAISIHLLLYTQDTKLLHFDEAWQVVAENAATVYKCNCTVNAYDQLNGPFVCIHIESGQVVKEYLFKNNVLHGKIKEYYPSGVLKLEAEYNNGTPINFWKEYDENGRITLDRNFNENSQTTQDYFTNDTPYEKAIYEYYGKKEELPIYETDCIALEIEEQRYICSEERVLAYLANPPIPPSYKNDPAFAGKSIECLFQFRINNKGIVDAVKIIKSTGDDFLDELVEAHVLNMLPFEAAKKNGVPIHYWKDAQIIFKF